jgi:hypothetical protein
VPADYLTKASGLLSASYGLLAARLANIAPERPLDKTPSRRIGAPRLQPRNPSGVRRTARRVMYDIEV